jgi:hypothetical protein
VDEEPTGTATEPVP